MTDYHNPQRFTFIFNDGPLDGEATIHFRDSRGAPYPERALLAFYRFADDGRVGATFQAMSRATHDVLEKEIEIANHKFQNHLYEITERHDDGDHVTIHAKYLGPE